MFRHAHFPAAQPDLSLNALSVLILCCQSRSGERSKPPAERFDCARIPAAIGTNSGRRERMSDFGASGNLPSRIPSSTRGHASGPIRRPAARRRSASPDHPNKPTTGLPGTPIAAPLWGPGSSQKKFESRSKERRSNFFRAPPRKHSWALGNRAHSLTS
jgi:hypothetical protein